MLTLTTRRALGRQSHFSSFPFPLCSLGQARLGNRSRRRDTECPATLLQPPQHHAEQTLPLSSSILDSEHSSSSAPTVPAGAPGTPGYPCPTPLSGGSCGRAQLGLPEPLPRAPASRASRASSGAGTPGIPGTPGTPRPEHGPGLALPGRSRIPHPGAGGGRELPRLCF